MPHHAAITRRELEVLTMISDECSNKEIAQRLFISEYTATSHRKNLMRKLAARNMAGLISKGYRSGILKLEQKTNSTTNK